MKLLIRNWFEQQKSGKKYFKKKESRFTTFDFPGKFNGLIFVEPHHSVMLSMVERGQVHSLEKALVTPSLLSSVMS